MKWESVALAKIADVFNGKTPSELEQRKSGHPVLKIRDVDEQGRFRGIFSGFVEHEFAEKYSNRKLAFGDTLILNAAHSATHVASKTFYVGEDVHGALATGEWLIIRSDSSSILPHFLNHWINWDRTRHALFGLVNGIHLYPKDVARLEIPLPSMEEQNRIAAILEKADAIRRKRQVANRLTDEFLCSVFLDMFGDPVTNPKGWENSTLGDMARVERGKFSPRPRNDPSFYNGEYPFIQTGDIADSDGQVKIWHQTLNARGITVSRSFPKGTIVMAIVGATIGRTAILGFESYCPDSVVGIQPYVGKATSFYLEQVLRMRREELLRRAPHTARANINLEILRPFPILKPPLPLQQRFSKIVLSVSKQKQRNEEASTQVDCLFSVIQLRAFQGKL
jgi:type I restriction enzyme, S subunit